LPKLLKEEAGSDDEAQKITQ